MQQCYTVGLILIFLDLIIFGILGGTSLGTKDYGLTHSDIVWYHRVYYDVEIIDNCGSFPNVSLLGTKGCISYNLVHARHQLGYPMKDKPKSILVSDFFLKEGEDHKATKGRD